MVRLSAVLFLIATVASAHSIVDVAMSFDAPAFVPVSQNFRYRVIADDHANDVGSGIVVTITLPSQLTISTITPSATWNCTQSRQTITCSANNIVPGPNPIDINVVAPPQPASLHATANVQSLGSLDLNPANDNAASDVVIYQPSACTAAAPQLLAPAEGASEPPVVPLTWTASSGATSYTVYTAVEGAAAGAVMTTGTTGTEIAAEPGASEWWIVANFGTCPPIASTHRHFIALATLPRPVKIYAGDPDVPATRDGPLLVATLRAPYGLALSPAGELYVSDEADNVVRKIANNNVATISGTPGATGSTNGQFALFDNPRGLAVTPFDGYVYAADALNHEIRILYTGGVFVSAFDAGGTPDIAGNTDDTSDKAQFNMPSGVAATQRGTLYVADTANNRIRKMAQVPGFVGFFNVTTVVSALHAPLGVAVDANETVYIADTGDGSIRKANGTIIASGLNRPTGITLDSRGNLFVTEGHSVRRIAPSGLMTTIASGFTSPAGIVVDSADRIFVADPDAHTILVIEPAQVQTRRRAAHM